MAHCICFDLDGTLVDSQTGIIASMQHAIATVNCDLPSQVLLRTAIGQPLAEGLTRLLPNVTNRGVSAIVAAYAEHYDRIGIHQLTLFPGIRQFLADLKQRSIHLAIVTSKPTHVARSVLRQTGLSTFFEVVAGASDSPKNELLARAMREFGSCPNQTQMVGDRKHDVDAAVSCAAHSVGVTYGYGRRSELVGAAAIVDTVDELRQTTFRWIDSHE